MKSGYLRRFSIDELKVDRSFVRDIPVDIDASAIVAAVVGMARGLGLSVVAEGVEHRDQLKFLQSLGTDEFQGYLVSKPVPPDACGQFLGKSAQPS